MDHLILSLSLCLHPPFNHHRGHSLVAPEEVQKHYGGTHVPMHVMDSAPSGSKWKLTQFLDNFSIPEATLFADVLEVCVFVEGRERERGGWRLCASACVVDDV